MFRPIKAEFKIEASKDLLKVWISIILMGIPFFLFYFFAPMLFDSQFIVYLSIIFATIWLFAIFNLVFELFEMIISYIAFVLTKIPFLSLPEPDSIEIITIWDKILKYIALLILAFSFSFAFLEFTGDDLYSQFNNSHEIVSFSQNFLVLYSMVSFMAIEILFQVIEWSYNIYYVFSLFPHKSVQKPISINKPKPKKINKTTPKKLNLEINIFSDEFNSNFLSNEEYKNEPLIFKDLDERDLYFSLRE